MPSSRPLVERADVQIAVNRECERTRYRRRAHEKDVRALALRGKQGAMLYAEPVLLVNQRKSKPAKRRAFLNERMRADDERWCCRANDSRGA